MQVTFNSKTAEQKKHSSKMEEERSSEEILRIIENAKLHPTDLNPIVQEVHFHEDFGGTECKLLELDPEVEKFLETGSSLVIRGSGEDSAMMCTQDSTFELKDAEISNSLLLLESLYYPDGTKKSSPPSELSEKRLKVNDEDDESVPERIIYRKQILGIAHSYYEMRRVKPNMGKIIHLLEATSYSGKDNEYQTTASQLKSMEDVLSEVSASVNEIKAYLQTVKYIELSGFLRLVECDYLFRVLNFVLGIVEENSWNNRSIERSTVIAQLSTLEPDFILEKVFQWFFVRVQAPTHEDDEDSLTIDEELYSMNEDSICNLFGEVILKRGQKFNLREFTKSWQESVPRGLKVNLKQLKHISIVDEASSPPTIRYFPEYNLPSNTQDRLQVLFDAKSKWKHEEIMPFISNLATTEQNASVLLTKFCRVTSPEGVKTYSAKYR